MMNATIEYEALRWRGLGYSPIPLIYPSKRPSVRWTHWRGKLPPELLVRAWFRQGERNLGVVLDKHLTVLDFDTPDSYEEWSRIVNMDTYAVTTARGVHIYVKLDDAPESTGTMANYDGDVKASGYVVTAPSRHPSGVLYQVLNDAPIASARNLEELGVEIGNIYNPMYFGDDRPRRYAEGEGVVAKINSQLNVAKVLADYGVQIIRRGYSYVCKCPFHQDHNPSMAVYLDSVFCFTCGCEAHRRIDALGLWSMFNRIPVREAIRHWAKFIPEER